MTEPIAPNKDYQAIQTTEAIQKQIDAAAANLKYQDGQLQGREEYNRVVTKANKDLEAIRQSAEAYNKTTVDANNLSHDPIDKDMFTPKGVPQFFETVHLMATPDQVNKIKMANGEIAANNKAIVRESPTTEIINNNLGKILENNAKNPPKNTEPTKEAIEEEIEKIAAKNKPADPKALVADSKLVAQYNSSIEKQNEAISKERARVLEHNKKMAALNQALGIEEGALGSFQQMITPPVIKLEQTPHMYGLPMPITNEDFAKLRDRNIDNVEDIEKAKTRNDRIGGDNTALLQRYNIKIAAENAKTEGAEVQPFRMDMSVDEINETASRNSKARIGNTSQINDDSTSRNTTYDPQPYNSITSTANVPDIKAFTNGNISSVSSSAFNEFKPLDADAIKALTDNIEPLPENRPVQSSSAYSAPSYESVTKQLEALSKQYNPSVEPAKNSASDNILRQTAYSELPRIPTNFEATVNRSLSAFDNTVRNIIPDAARNVINAADQTVRNTFENTVETARRITGVSDIARNTDNIKPLLEKIANIEEPNRLKPADPTKSAHPEAYEKPVVTDSTKSSRTGSSITAGFSLYQLTQSVNELLSPDQMKERDGLSQILKTTGVTADSVDFIASVAVAVQKGSPEILGKLGKLGIPMAVLSTATRVAEAARNGDDREVIALIGELGGGLGGGAIGATIGAPGGPLAIIPSIAGGFLGAAGMRTIAPIIFYDIPKAMEAVARYYEEGNKPNPEILAQWLIKKHPELVGTQDAEELQKAIETKYQILLSPDKIHKNGPDKITPILESSNNIQENSYATLLAKAELAPKNLNPQEANGAMDKTPTRDSIIITAANTRLQQSFGIS